MAHLKYSRPEPMDDDELGRILVPLDRVEADLPAVLEEHGVAVVTGVVEEAELAELEGRWIEDLRRAHESSSSSPEAERGGFISEGTGPRHFPVDLAGGWTMGNGFAMEGCLMHGDFSWRVRRHPGVHRAFASLFRDELGAAADEAEGEGTQQNHLVTSLDAPFFSPPKRLDNDDCSANSDEPEEKHKRLSAHVDQNPHDARPDLRTRQTYQGVLYVWPSDDPSATATVVWPGSHRPLPEFGWDVAPSEVLTDDVAAKMRGEMGCHYVEMASMRSNVEQRDKLVDGWRQHARTVPVPAGGLLLWNSKLIHTGWGGGARLAQAVCLEPASRRPEQERISKLRLCAMGLPSTHWASVGMQHDMVLFGRGWLEDEVVAVGGTCIVDEDSESSSRSRLPVCVDWEKMKCIGGVHRVREKLETLIFKGQRTKGDYLTGMWDHRKSKMGDVAEFLEELILPEYQPFI